MKNYENFEPEDFAADDDFITWCLIPDQQSVRFWNDWIQKHPERRLKVLEAKQLVSDIRSIETEAYQVLDENEIWDNIDAQISKEEKPRIFHVNWALSAAASLLLLIGAFFFFFQNESQLEKEADEEWVKIENNSGITKSILLSDNSTVELEPFSHLRYPKEFNGTQRKVILKGEAFFDIARDTTKPFMVFANETITKVLGTSFRIIAFEGNKKVEVEVKTGKVAVYANVPSGENFDEKKRIIIEADVPVILPMPNKKLEVTPNQKVVFDKVAEEMVKAIIPEPTIVTEIEEIDQLEFNSESVVAVFEALELAYGIEIEFDESQLSDCTITTKLDEEPLFEKLDIICMALDLKYTKKDVTVIIEGNGCK